MAEDATDVDVEAPETDTLDATVTDSGTQPNEDGTPAEQPEQPDWEKRYKDLQSAYTTTSQEAAELRQYQQEQTFLAGLSDPETQDAHVQHLVEQMGEAEARVWLEEHGFEIDDEESDDTSEFRDPRVDQFLAEQQQQQVNAQAEQAEKGTWAKIDAVAAEKSLDLTPELRDTLFDAALTKAQLSGKPLEEEAAAVVQQHAQWLDAQLKAYRATKRDQPAPPVPGGSGTPNPSLDTPQSRLALANQVADEAYGGS